jgi:hypothetical protein
MAMPQLVDWLAKESDTDPSTGHWYQPSSKPMPRKAKGTLENIQESVPWWRKGLPVDRKKLPAGAQK